MASWRARFCFVLVQQLLLCSANTPDNNIGVNLDRNLYEGDIVLSKEQALGVSGTGSHPDGSTTGARTARAVVPHASEKWADGVVPYLFSPQLNDSAIAAILSAMDQVEEDSEGGVTFVERLPSHSDYLYFFPGGGCYSFIGRQGGEQNISIGRKCEEKGVVMHELVHALGRWHEQSRPDRDQHIRVNKDNIREGSKDNFDIAGGSSTQDLAYDFDSIMHYDAYAFSGNGQPTLEPLDGSVALGRLGQRNGLSGTDKEHLRSLYPAKYGEWSRWNLWSHCSASCGSGYQQRTRVCLGEEEGRLCQGPSTEQRLCTQGPCPTEKPQQWGAWSPWSGCSVTCGGGDRLRVRDCLAGSGCQGDYMQKENCNEEACPEVAQWSSWGAWSPCSSSCEGGLSRRSRKCLHKDGRAGAGEGSSEVKADHLCLGSAVESRECSQNINCSNPAATPAAAGRTCSTQRCFEDTCLAGLERVGCYAQATPTDPTTPSNLGESVNTDVDTATAKAHSLKNCGKYAQTEGYLFFSLRQEHCQCGSSPEDIIGSSLSQRCDKPCEGCAEVYRITDQASFQLSVAAFESCGQDYCVTGVEGGSALVGEGVWCSGSRQTVSHLTQWLLIALGFVWKFFLC